MKNYIFDEYQKIAIAIIEEIKRPYNVDFWSSYTNVKDLYTTAQLYNKRQNSYLKDGFEHEEVHTFIALDLTDNQVKHFSIKACKRWSLKQWFTLLFCAQICSSIQEIKTIIK